MNPLVIGGTPQRIERGAKFRIRIGGSKRLLGRQRLPLLDKREMTGIGNALKRIDLHGTIGLAGLCGISENQLSCLSRLGWCDLRIGHDGDGLAGILRKRDFTSRKKAGHDYDGRQKRTVHRAFPPEMTGRPRSRHPYWSLWSSPRPVLSFGDFRASLS